VSALPTTARAVKRDLVGRLLSAGIPALGGRVYEARVWPMKLPELPAALVFGWQETKTRKTLDAWTHQFEVSCTMAIHAMVQAPDGPTAEYLLEYLAGEIERVILTSPELLGLTGTLERIDRVETKLEATATTESVQGTLTMGFDMIWTEVQQVTVPAGEPTTTFQVKSIPTKF
jgi:hypothetical protein